MPVPVPPRLTVVKGRPRPIRRSPEYRFFFLIFYFFIKATSRLKAGRGRNRHRPGAGEAGFDTLAKSKLRRDPCPSRPGQQDKYTAVDRASPS